MSEVARHFGESSPTFLGRPCLLALGRKRMLTQAYSEPAQIEPNDSNLRVGLYLTGLTTVRMLALRVAMLLVCHPGPKYILRMKTVGPMMDPHSESHPPEGYSSPPGPSHLIPFWDCYGYLAKMSTMEQREELHSKVHAKSWQLWHPGHPG